MSDKESSTSNLKMGNAVEKLAKPIARAIDKVFKTDLENCESCDEIRRLLNDKKFAAAIKKRLGLGSSPR